MLYSLIAANIVLSICAPLIAVWAFIKGYNLKAEKVAEKPLKVLRKASGKAPEGDPKLMALLDNINCYDGTEKGQKEIDG